MGCVRRYRQTEIKERIMGYRLNLCWARILTVLDYCIVNHPFTFMLIPWIIHDYNSICLVAITCILDNIPAFVAVDIYDYRFYRKIKKDSIDKGLSGHLTSYESDLVDQFRNAAIRGIKQTKLPRIDNSIKVFFSDKLSGSSTAFPSHLFGSIILLRERLNDKTNKAKCYYQLAHELGHVQHFHNGFQYSIIPVVLVLFELLIVYHMAFNLANSYLGIVVMICVFNANAVALSIYRKELNFKSEYEADLVGLNIIKEELGVEEMRVAASFYLKNRINNVRTLKNRKQFSLNSLNRKAMLFSIKALARLVPQKEIETLLERSEERSASNEKDFEGNVIMASKKWSIEKQIQEALKKSNDERFAPFPSEIILEGEKTMTYQYLISGVITVAFITLTLRDYTYTLGYLPLWIALVLFIVFYGINTLILELIWKKTKKLLKQIGV